MQRQKFLFLSPTHRIEPFNPTTELAFITNGNSSQTSSPRGLQEFAFMVKRNNLNGIQMHMTLSLKLDAKLP